MLIVFTRVSQPYQVEFLHLSADTTEVSNTGNFPFSRDMIPGSVVLQGDIKHRREILDGTSYFVEGPCVRWVVGR